jgi:hypothetical protein
MGESTSQIERDIAAERNELGRNLQLLEHRARSLTDWRSYFRNHPFTMMAVALGGGVLLGSLVGGSNAAAGSDESEPDDSYNRSPRLAESQYSGPTLFSTSAARVRRQFGDTWDHIADALLSVASVKAIEFVSDLVPGFREQFAAKHPEHRGSYSKGPSV